MFNSPNSMTLLNFEKYRAKLHVELLNPEVVQDYLEEVGKFAAVCYATDTNEVAADKIAKHCISSGHMSPTRATYFIFKVSGISRDCSHQIVRHRVGVEINQRSQRYCDESMPSIIIPQSIINNPEALTDFLFCQNVIYHTYRRLKNVHGISIDDARSVLSNATETEMNIAFTPQALMHFCNERCCSRASWQIRDMAWTMAKLVGTEEPYFQKLLVPKCDKLGYCPEAKSSCCGRRPHKDDVLTAYDEWLKLKS